MKKKKKRIESDIESVEEEQSEEYDDGPINSDLFDESLSDTEKENTYLYEDGQDDQPEDYLDELTDIDKFRKRDDKYEKDEINECEKSVTWRDLEKIKRSKNIIISQKNKHQS